MLFVYLSSLITTVLFFLSKPSGFNFGDNPWQYSSQLLALVGTTLFCLNYVLSSRAKFLDKLFGGLDKLYKVHHVLGAVSFVLVVNHPIFLAVKALPNSMAARNYIFVGNNLSYNLGVFSLYSLILVLFFTFIIKLPYHRWLSIHKIIGIPLFFAILHVVLITSDVSRYLPLRLWIILLQSAAVVGYIYKLVIYDRLGPSYQYKVNKIIRKQSISDIYLSPVSKPMVFNPGQYAFVSFKQKFISSESHPFSISSSPQDPEIRLSIKSLGDFTTALAGLVEGSLVSLTGPYGQFGSQFNQGKPIVCVAGGIGITPFLSLIKSETTKPLSRPIYFYNCVKTVEESIYQSEILECQSKLNTLKYYLACTDSEGRLTASKISLDIPDFKNCLYFICGPIPMMESLSAQLQKLGVKKKYIIYENFGFGPSN